MLFLSLYNVQYMILVWFICLMTYQPLMGYLMLKINTNNLHMVLWFQEFLSNTNNLFTIIWFLVIIPSYMVSSNSI